MPNTITIRKALSSGDDAAAARDRLASAGFAREDIAVDQVDQHFELSGHTPPEHAQRFRVIMDRCASRALICAGIPSLSAYSFQTARAQQERQRLRGRTGPGQSIREG